MGRIRRFLDWLFMTGPEGLSDRTDPQDATANSVANQVAQTDAERAIMPYELLRYVAGCVVIVVVALGFFGMIEKVGPYLAGADTKVEVFGFEFVEHLVWVPTAVSAVFAGAFWRLRKLKKNTDRHLGKRNRHLEDSLVFQEEQKEFLRLERDSLRVANDSLSLGNEPLREENELLRQESASLQQENKHVCKILARFVSEAQIQTFKRLGKCARAELEISRDDAKAEGKMGRLRDVFQMANDASSEYLSIAQNVPGKKQGAQR